MANSSEAIGQTTTPGQRPHSKIIGVWGAMVPNAELGIIDSIASL